MELQKYLVLRILANVILRKTLLLSHFGCVQLFATPWTAAYQAPPSMGFSRQEYWGGVPLPSPQDNPKGRYFLYPHLIYRVTVQRLSDLFKAP